jgi:T5orf172 domain
MRTTFEPTKSFCYRVARYELLDQIAQEPEALSGQPFRMNNVTRRVIERNLTPEQLAIEIPAANADRIDTIYGTIRFFVQLHAKRLPNSPFIWLGDGGMYKLKEPADIEQEMEDVELAATDEDDVEDAASEFDGWIYAFSFPVLVQSSAPFPIKIGKTIKDVEERVAYQCKGSASFDNPIILGRWQVKRVSSVETAIHATLKSKGKWRENVPGTEWFNTTIAEVESIVRFIQS